MSQVTLAKVVEIEQAWMAKDDAIVHFGYQNHKPTFQALLKKFKEHEDFKDGYRLVTSNLPIIHIDKFDKFLVWHTKNKYRRNKI
ncbi:hypothetical protein [Enterococcus faecalis]|uniref:hypothetical protein n=1 Tax=Enterococcus faecalis TaxID=1351 RepID=UPI004040FF72